MKKLALNFSSIFLAVGLIIGASSCDKDDDDVTVPAAQQKTIATIAAEDGNFTILVDALTRTGLLATVSDPDVNLTVFAPDDMAFSKLLAELNLADLDAVEAALGTEGLKTVLMYHVLGMEVKASMVSTGYVSTAAMTADNDNLSFYIMADNNSVKINNRAMVITPDVDASNGVIHVIDKVILPLTIYQLLEVNSEYSSLTAALGVADGDLDDLTGDAAAGPFTLFAPDNMAFSDALVELNLADLNALVTALGTDGVADVLLYHVVAGNYNSDEVPSGAVGTVLMQDITISTTSGVEITDANGRKSMVKAVDIQGVNGVIHSINKVLLPL